MNIIVTGASRGIGFELVKYFSQFPEHRIIAIARNEALLEKLKQECFEEHSVDIISCSQDLCDRQYKSLLAATDSWDCIDILINNAGYLVNKPFEKLDQSDWNKLLDINLLSIVDLTKQLMSKLKASEHAHIVNIGSMGGYQGSSKFPGLSAYSVAKGALAILTECLAEELKDYNISSNCLCLGAVNTNMLNEAFPGYQAPVEPKDMAAIIGHFALNNHKVMNGQIIPVTLSNP